MTKSVTRLYTQFQPEKYELVIQLDEEAMRFSGHVVITGKKVGRPSQRLTFHANGVKVTSGKVTVRDKKGERELPLERINQKVSARGPSPHRSDGLPGFYTVEMAFEGAITDGMTGIYPCYWKDAAGNEQKLFATQFESHHAREAFPCIDEPEAKAVFALTLTTRAGVEVLSNTPVQEQTKGAPSGMLRTSFHETPRMSTYLLAFVTGDMHKKTARTKSGVEVNAWATAVQPVESLDFALDAATKIYRIF